jgi:hypothetical protein
MLAIQRNEHRMPEIGLRSVRTAMVVALLSCLAQASIAHADSAFCIRNVSSYVTELDQLLSKERNRITPFEGINARYMPFQGCTAASLLKEVSRSRFIQPIGYSPRTKEYFIAFSSDDVRIGFVYGALEKVSNTAFAGWVKK